MWEGRVATKNQEQRQGNNGVGVGLGRGDAHSAGRHQVLGKKWKSFGNIFSMRLMFLASRSLRQISLIPGKWLIFCREVSRGGRKDWGMR